jgi:hypothetical protein
MIKCLLTLLCILNLAVDCYAVMLPDTPDSKRRPEPHPWLATAPGEYLRLINRGNVQIQIDDETLNKYGRAALTRFEIKLDYRCIFRPPKGTNKNGEQITSLDVRYTKRDLSLHHRIIVPTSYKPEEPWQDRLLKHEMDHVAITTDPRLAELVRGLFSRGFTIKVQPSGERNAGTASYQSQAEQFTLDVVRELETLLQYQYDQLDRSSKDGLVELEDREAFFQSLYDYEACRKHLEKTLADVNQEQWSKWVKIDSKTLAAHYSLSR